MLRDERNGMGRGNGDGARYPEAGARARTDKTGETRLEGPRAG